MKVTRLEAKAVTLRDIVCGEMFVVDRDSAEDFEIISMIGFCPANELMRTKVITAKNGTEYTAIDPKDGAPYPIPLDTKVIPKESELIVK